MTTDHDNVRHDDRHHIRPSSVLSTIQSNPTNSTSERSSVDDDADVARYAARLQARLRLFFADPIRKLRLRKRRALVRPTVQLLKVVLVMMQLFVFSKFRFPHVDFVINQRLTLAKTFFGDRYWFCII